MKRGGANEVVLIHDLTIISLRLFFCFSSTSLAPFSSERVTWRAASSSPWSLNCRMKQGEETRRGWEARQLGKAR